MTELSNQQRCRIIDYVEQAIILHQPKDYSFKCDSGTEWFYINSSGQVAFNLKTIMPIIMQFVKQNPSYDRWLIQAGFSEIDSIQVAALQRKKIKEFKRQFRLNKSDSVVVSHVGEIKRCKREIRRLQKRQAFLEAEVRRMTIYDTW